jgi:hypothetical protein
MDKQEVDIKKLLVNMFYKYKNPSSYIERIQDFFVIYIIKM